MRDPSIGLALLECLLFVFFLHIFFMVTMASFSKPVATSALLDATLSAQIIPYIVKLQPMPIYKGEIDYKIIENWIYSVDNYFGLTSITDCNQ